MIFGVEVSIGVFHELAPNKKVMAKRRAILSLM